MYHYLHMPDELPRIARLGLGVGQEQLAQAAGLSPRTISKLESGVKVRLETKLKVIQTLERLGVEFIFPDELKGYGIRFRKEWKQKATEQ